MALLVVDDGSLGFFCGRRRGGRGIVVAMSAHFGLGIGRPDAHALHAVCHSLDPRGSLWQSDLTLNLLGGFHGLLGGLSLLRKDCYLLNRRLLSHGIESGVLSVVLGRL